MIVHFLYQNLFFVSFLVEELLSVQFNFLELTWRDYFKFSAIFFNKMKIKEF